VTLFESGEIGTGFLAARGARLAARRTTNTVAREVRALSADILDTPAVSYSKTAPNPWEDLRVVTPKRSMSAALGIVWGWDQLLWDLIDQMCDDDPTIAAAEQGIEDWFGSFPTRWVPADPGDVKGQEIADAANRVLLDVKGNFGWGNFLRCMRCGTWRHGFSIVQVFWGVADGMIVPTDYLHEHPSRFSFDRRGRVFFSTEGKAEQAPPYRFVVGRWNALYSNPFGQSQVFGLRFLYEIKKRAIKGWAVWAERCGTPLLIVYGDPERTKDNAGWKANAETFLKTLGVTSGAVFANGEKVEALRRDGGTNQNPSEPLIQAIDKMITRKLWGGELTASEGERAGSLAMAKQHGAMTRLKVAGVARWLEDVVTQGLGDPFVDLNFGTNAPRIRLMVDDEDSGDAKTSLALLTGAHQIGMDLVDAEAREMLGLRAPQGDDIVLPGLDYARGGSKDAEGLPSKTQVVPVGAAADELAGDEKKKPGSPPRSRSTIRDLTSRSR